ncbi:MAG: BlaI/MecI/CopY family transcriptional regulator [Planctomycetaceae bacterium]|nr:BlaI/MecI/CopY family transcriptional regulator [Planctomycetaceae bacterium]
MSKSKGTKKPSFIPLSEGEMELLDLLWKLGPSTLNVVHKNYSRPVGYTTIQTRLNRMVDKGVLQRSSDYPAQYEAIVEMEVASDSFFEKVAKICDGSLAPLIAHLSQRRKLNPDEIVMLKELIAKHE